MDLAAVAALSDTRVTAHYKGWPSTRIGDTVRDVVGLRRSIFDLGFLPPIAVLRRSALIRNSQTMMSFCDANGVRLAPHAKTHMSPQLAALQISSGAWGLTVATPSQARLFRSFGAGRILMANELVDADAIDWVTGELDGDPSFEFMCYIDSERGVDILARALARARRARPLDVLVELGIRGARTGTRSIDHALALARLASQSDWIRVRGVAGYEGVASRAREPGVTEIDVARRFAQRLRQAALRVATYADADASLVVSAGGSEYFDLITEELLSLRDRLPAAEVVLRGGCYLAHDSRLYAARSPFGTRIPGRLTPALEVWGSVLSAPEPGLALVGVGRRDLSDDEGMPVPGIVRKPNGGNMTLAEADVVGIDDQHAYVRHAANMPLEPGDSVQLGISHPCTTFDKWQLIPVVDDDYRLIDCVRTFF